MYIYLFKKSVTVRMALGVKTDKAKFLNVTACSSVKLPFLNYEVIFGQSVYFAMTPFLNVEEVIFFLYLYLEINQASSLYLPHISLQFS